MHRVGKLPCCSSQCRWWCLQRNGATWCVGHRDLDVGGEASQGMQQDRSYELPCRRWLFEYRRLLGWQQSSYPLPGQVSNKTQSNTTKTTASVVAKKSLESNLPGAVLSWRRARSEAAVGLQQSLTRTMLFLSPAGHGKLSFQIISLISFGKVGKRTSCAC